MFAGGMFTAPHDTLLGAAVKPKRGKGQGMTVKQLEFLNWGYNLPAGQGPTERSKERSAHLLCASLQR